MLKLTREELERMAAVDVRTVDLSALTDLRDIQIDTSLPVAKKLEAFASQTGNVYINRIGDYVVKVKFQEKGASMEDKMMEYLQRLAEVHFQGSSNYLFFGKSTGLKRQLVYAILQSGQISEAPDFFEKKVRSDFR